MTRFSLPTIVPLQDTFERRITYLRVSLTDRCNFRCSYCMPEDVSFSPRDHILTFEEIERLIDVFTTLGVKRVRLTGGEPTVRRDMVTLVRRLTAIPQLDTLVMTSNGTRLPALAEPLSRAGLAGINISLDSVRADRFASLTRRDQLANVIAGIDASIAAGLEVKLNAVALPDTDDQDIVELCEFAWERGIVTRFIEHMPMSSGALYSESNLLSAAHIRKVIVRHYGRPLVETRTQTASLGPSRYWHLEGAPHRQVGIISAMSDHFCADCNRVRLSATGDLHPCLGYDQATSLRDAIRAGASDDELRVAIRETLNGKKVGHMFQETGGGAPSKHMVSIGG